MSTSSRGGRGARDGFLCSGSLSRHFLNMKWLTVREVCETAAIARPTLYRYWTLGSGPRFVQRGSRRLVRADWLDDWMFSLEVA